MEGTPRKVKFDKLFGDTTDDKLPGNVAKLFAGAWGAVFATIQVLDPEFETVSTDGVTSVQYPIWHLEDEEKTTLGNATAEMLKSLPAGEKKKYAKLINKYAPLISFSIALGTAAVPRVQYSAKAKKARTRVVRTLEKQRPQSGAGTASGASARTETPPGEANNGVPPRGAAYDSVSAAFDGVL